MNEGLIGLFNYCYYDIYNIKLSSLNFSSLQRTYSENHRSMAVKGHDIPLWMNGMLCVETVAIIGNYKNFPMSLQTVFL
jgi:hypothetical protein